MLKQTLSQKLQQKLSPQQIQVIKMLEIPILELEEKIKQELEENPALEEGEEISEKDSEDTIDEMTEDENQETSEDIDLGDYLTEDDIPDYKLQTNNRSKEDKQADIPFSVGETFHEQLMEQLRMQEIPEDKFLLGEYIIGNIDDEGYLQRNLESISDDLAFHVGIEVSEKELEKVLKTIQEFDPPGVGARSLQECLTLQLAKKEQTESVKLATRIVTDFFEEFVKKHYDKIEKKLNVSSAVLKKTIDEILKLNPKPGNAYGNIIEKGGTQIIPDFFLENIEGELYLSLNDKNVPELRVNKTYTDMFKDYASSKEKNKDMKDAVLFVKQKLDAAKSFIDAVKQRHTTMLAVMQAIVDFQKEYFQEGDEVLLKPMILKDIADITGYDISTISRVSNSKYIQTQFGIFPVKYFFSESMQTNSGEEVSSREIKSILQSCIEEENKKKPLADEVLAKMLHEKGYCIARRTVAKYREQLGIPVARLRKKM